MSTDRGKSCNECGFMDCAHMTAVVVATTLPEVDEVYNPHIDSSLDHKNPGMRGQSIHFAMMRYFGSGDGDGSSLLCYDWLKVRGPLEPLNDMGSYLAYRRNYNFDELK